MRKSATKSLSVICYLLVIGYGAIAHAQTAVVPEYSLKAAYVYHFVQYTEWPESLLAGLDTLAICVSADSPLRAALAAIDHKTAHGKPIVVQTYESGKTGPCQVVIFSVNDKESLQKAYGNFLAPNVLTIADDNATAADKVIITLFVDDGRVVFAIDRTLARSSGLNISAKLLRLARSVK